MTAGTTARVLTALIVAGAVIPASATPPPVKDVAVTSKVQDYAAAVAPALTIQSDGNINYPHSKTLTSQIQSIGDWVLDSINPRNANRQIYLNFSQPVAGSGPGGSDPIAVTTGLYQFRALAQCSTYGNSLLGFTAGQTKDCPLRIGFDVGAVRYAVVMNPTGGVNGPFPTTNAVTVTCIYPTSGSAACSQWRLTPSGTYIAPDSSLKYRNVAKLLEVDAEGNVAADHGDFYLSFEILIQK